MFKKILNKKLLKNQKGLTLIELLAVIVILAIIAAIAIPAIGNIINNSRDKAIISEGLNIISGAKIAKMDGVCDGTATNPCDQTKIADYVDGVTGGASVAYSVTYDGKEWKLASFNKFDKIKGTKYQIKDTEKTEEKLKEKLEGK
ncbi:prepilin-type N-terminal cleavage/methylation domain-containing protein [Lysinibacillus sp. NPDC056185]|uniref:prepilin-type N-terminal cleavage/methylation domain-containing protein n=1 Tax=Lysinibacillus sp. NPDC056185 TaxID=3345739 RepID=UPI0039EF4B7C